MSKKTFYFVFCILLVSLALPACSDNQSSESMLLESSATNALALTDTPFSTPTLIPTATLMPGVVVSYSLGDPSPFTSDSENLNLEMTDKGVRANLSSASALYPLENVPSDLSLVVQIDVDESSDPDMIGLICNWKNDNNYYYLHPELGIWEMRDGRRHMLGEQPGGEESFPLANLGADKELLLTTGETRIIREFQLSCDQGELSVIRNGLLLYFATDTRFRDGESKLVFEGDPELAANVVINNLEIYDTRISPVPIERPVLDVDFEAPGISLFCSNVDEILAQEDFAGLMIDCRDGVAHLSAHGDLPANAFVFQHGHPSLDSLLLDVDYRFETDDSFFGIVFRHNSDGYYMFMIGDNGDYDLIRFNPEDGPTGFRSLINGPNGSDWWSNTDLQKDVSEFNHLRVRALGFHLEIWLEGTELIDVGDSSVFSHTAGTNGLALGVFNGDRSEVTLDNYRIDFPW